MEALVVILFGMTLALLVLWHMIYHVVREPVMSGDKWYIRHMAFTKLPASAPYCWRPLHPFLGRMFGFFTVSYLASVATPLIIYYWMGGGLRGFLVALLFLGNTQLFAFHIKNPEYTEALGHLLFICALWAMQVDSIVAYPLLLLCALCRETIAAALLVIAVVWNPLMCIPILIGSAVAYFTRKEDKENRHPLVEATPYETLKRWLRTKQEAVVNYAHIIQPLRGLAITVPFMWERVGDFARVGTLGLLPIWLLALPASGQSRIVCYGFAIIAPFAAELPIGWLWGFVFLAWFWPIDIAQYKETGERTFGFVS